MGFLNEPGAGHFHEELVFCGDMRAGRGFSCTRICSFKPPYPLQSGPKSRYAAIPFEALRKILRPTPGLRMTGLRERLRMTAFREIQRQDGLITRTALIVAGTAIEGIGGRRALLSQMFSDIPQHRT